VPRADTSTSSVRATSQSMQCLNHSSVLLKQMASRRINCNLQEAIGYIGPMPYMYIYTV
jgi:hypothetical protein